MAPRAVAPIPYFVYTDRALDHGWLRHCDGFDALRRSAYNERFAEVYVRDALMTHSWRTDDPTKALLVFVPIWEIVSFNVGECNGTTHTDRMAAAAAALKRSPLFKQASGRQSGKVHSKPGFNHMMVSSGCIEKGKRLSDRLGRPLAKRQFCFS